MTDPSQQRPEPELALRSFRRAFATVGAFSLFINLLMLAPPSNASGGKPAGIRRRRSMTVACVDEVL